MPKVKENLAGLSLTQESLKKTWGGVSRTITAEEFAAAFCHWFEWCKKGVCIVTWAQNDLKKING